MKYMYMKPVWKAVFVLVALSHMYAYFLASTKAWYSNTRPKELKYVGFTINWGRMCNQLYHLITGYGIARTLNRVHYLPYNKDRLQHAQKY